MLQVQAGVIALRPGEADTPIWSLLGPAPDIKRGDELTITVANELPVAVTLNWHGLDGVQAAEPLAARAPVSPRAGETLEIPLRHAGTFMWDLRLLGDGQARPLPARALVVNESEPVPVDGDQVFLVEDWRVSAGRHGNRAWHRSKGHDPDLHGQWADYAGYSHPHQ